MVWNKGSCSGVWFTPDCFFRSSSWQHLCLEKVKRNFFHHYKIWCSTTLVCMFSITLKSPLDLLILILSSEQLPRLCSNCTIQLASAYKLQKTHANSKKHVPNEWTLATMKLDRTPGQESYLLLKELLQRCVSKWSTCSADLRPK